MQDSQSSEGKDSPAAAVLPALSDNVRAQRSALLIVFLVMFVDLLGFGIVLPLIPLYADAFIDPLFPKESYEKLHGVIIGGLMMSFSLMQFLVAPIWGRMSDRHGRRPFLLLGLAGSVFSYTLFGFASDWGAEGGRQALGLVLLFVARIGAGIAGATVSTAQAVIADSTSPEKRSRGMALIGFAFGLGFTFGPAIAAVCLFFFPAFRGLAGYVAAGLSLIALGLGTVLMPETRRPGAAAGRRGWFHWEGIRLAARTPTVGTLIIIFFLSTFAFGNFETTLSLSLRDLFGLSKKAGSPNFASIALVFVYIGVVLGLAQGGLYQTLARRGVTEIRFMLMGGLLMALGLGGLAVTAKIAFAQDVHGGGLFWSAFLLCSTLAVIGFAFMTPSVQALVSRRSDPERQGEILGVNQSVNALARILGPAAGPSLYFLSPAHVFPFVFAVTLLVAAVLLTLRVRHA